MTQQARIDRGFYWDRAWSLVEGCSPVSAGCDHCWSAQQAHIRSGQSNEKIWARYNGLTDSNGHWTGKIRLMEQDLHKPLKVQKPTTWAVWNDLFHKDVPESFLLNAFDTMTETPQHTYLVLTKRPVRMYEFITSLQNAQFHAFESLHSNVCLGVTVENSDYLWRVGKLLKTPAVVHYISVEPMLGPINISPYLPGFTHRTNKRWVMDTTTDSRKVLNQVICGAETGPHKRPMKLPWAQSLRDQCAAASTPFFFKRDSDGNHDLDGRTWEEFPINNLARSRCATAQGKPGKETLTAPSGKVS